MTSTFNDIFASVLRADSNKQDRSVTYEDLLILILKLLGKLVQTPLPDQMVRSSVKLELILLVYRQEIKISIYFALLGSNGH